jgi:hypothetical protein
VIALVRLYFWNELETVRASPSWADRSRAKKGFDMSVLFRRLAAAAAASLLVWSAVVPAARADERPAGPFTVYGPSCRFAACWAMVANEAGWGTVVRGRGVISTRALAAAKLRELTAQGSEPAAALPAPVVCFATAGGTDL